MGRHDNLGSTLAGNCHVWSSQNNTEIKYNNDNTADEELCARSTCNTAGRSSTYRSAMVRREASAGDRPACTYLDWACQINEREIALGGAGTHCDSAAFWASAASSIALALASASRTICLALWEQRLEGSTLAEVGDCIGIDKQNVHYLPSAVLIIA